MKSIYIHSAENVPQCSSMRSVIDVHINDAGMEGWSRSSFSHRLLGNSWDSIRDVEVIGPHERDCNEADQ
jgi:hypothetical protein